MRVYEIKSSKDKLFFTNYKRIDEEIVFNDIMNILKTVPSITIGNKTIGPSEDIYKCTASGEEFELLFDIDYGGCIQSNSEKVLVQLQNILNN